MGENSMKLLKNKLKIKDIKTAHKKLKKDEFLRVFLTGGVIIDLYKDTDFTIDYKHLCVNNLVAYTENIILFDILKLLKE
jgi:hypothetical protein